VFSFSPYLFSIKIVNSIDISLSNMCYNTRVEYGKKNQFYNIIKLAHFGLFYNCVPIHNTELELNCRHDKNRERNYLYVYIYPFIH